MYKSFFGLDHRPFSKTPDPHYLFLAPSYEEAFARLEYAVEERDFAVLTGEIGCGKTTLTRALMDHFDEEPVILIINPLLTPNQFLREVARRLGLTPRFFRTDLLEQIHNQLYSLYEEGKRPILIVDEAQLVPSKNTLEEIRLLTNFQLDDTNLLSIILVGQPELRKRLRHAAYGAIRQRIGIWYHLESLSLEDTEGYIRFRLQQAGGDPDLFSSKAMALIHTHSQGIPRLINTICTNSLLAAFGDEQNPIEADIVLEVVEDAFF